MLTIEDCIALSELTEEEIAAISEHEHIPQMVAAALGHFLIELPGGERRIHRMILDDLAAAGARGDHAHAAVLRLALMAFLHKHPQPSL